MKLNVEEMAEMLPSLRAEIARELSLSHKLNQKEVAQLLGVSQPAVSQYLRRIRGKKREIYNENVQKEIKILCEKIINGMPKQDLENELYNLCKLGMQKLN
ncbi:MAG: helix-turn-helix domain-containing protein [Candidatus Aenigmarchaeota archaeon]|nr:helix-turn-helix domain-containing protein [Candidatus Aenigmarchaeota archaeon]